ncbi:MAG TPA: hypothetical protein VG387_09225 [Rhizomicrobium sp.]|jgi:hypothetical protein|nr:hypothetical protein [Rhizomicrobium sp.]
MAAMIFLTALSGTAQAAEPSNDALIDQLATLHADTVGIASGGVYDSFIAEDGLPRFEMGLLPVDSVDVPAPMRALVRRGAAALPALLAHLGDARPTGIVVSMAIGGKEVPFNQFFSDEYDPRYAKDRAKDCTWGMNCREMRAPYTVKIGDVCEVLIGQIVNRNLIAARYQPTMLFYVNSPIETPSIAAWVKRDWTGLDAATLEASLLADLRGSEDWRSDGALRRLRYYDPDTYAALAGTDRAKRDTFETQERREKAGQK